MPLEDFQIGSDLGKGSFGCVVKCIRRSDGEVYAMKQVYSLLFRSNFKNSKKKIKKMHLIKLDSWHPYQILLSFSINKLFMINHRKNFVLSWNMPIKEIFNPK